MKKIIYTAIALCIASSGFSQEIDPESFKEKNSKEVIEGFSEIIALLSFFENFAPDSDRWNPEKDKEKFSAPYTIFSEKEVQQKFNEAFNAKLSINQQITVKKSRLGLEDYFSSSKFDIGDTKVEVIPETVYYYDGTKEVLKDAEPLDLHFTDDWHERKRIDSIRCKYRCKYVSKVDTVSINLKKPTIFYEGKEIHLEKLENNYALYTYNDSLDIFHTEGLNKTRKVLDDYHSSGGKGTPEESQNWFDNLGKEINILLPEMQKDSLMTKEAFQEKYAKKIEQLFDVPSDQPQFRQIWFYGNVKALRLYFTKETKEIEAYKTIHREDNANFFIDYDDENTYWLDNDGKIIDTKAGDYTQINDYFYEDNKFYYYLNPKTRQLQKITTYYAIAGINEDYVSAQVDEDSPMIILDKNNQPVFNTDFESIKVDDNVTRAYTKTDVLIIPKDGTPKWLRNIDSLAEFENGYAVLEQNHLYGFIDENANIVIPAEYEAVEEFSDFSDLTPVDELFAVSKNGLFGFVDKNNHVVIPFQYKEVEPFSYGVTLVKNKEGRRALINYKNQIIVPFKEVSATSTSSNFGKRQYGLNGESYNYLGERLKDDEE